MAAEAGWGRGAKNALFLGWGYRWGYKVGLHFPKSGVTHSGVLGGGIEGRELAVLKG